MAFIIQPSTTTQPPVLNGSNAGGSKSGVPGGTTTVPGGLTSVPGTPAAAAQPGSPLNLMFQGWRPGSFLNLAKQLADPKMAPQAAQALDQAFTLAFTNLTNLQAQVASFQQGTATVTGSILAIPTGLASVSNCGGSIDNGATAHNLWLSVTASKTPGAVDVYVWKPTASGNNTPVAATTAVLVRWWAQGSLT